MKAYPGHHGQIMLEGTQTPENSTAHLASEGGHWGQAGGDGILSRVRPVVKSAREGRFRPRGRSSLRIKLQVEKSRDHLGVKSLPRLFVDVLPDSPGGPGRPVGSVGAQGIPAIDDGEDAG